MSWLLFVLGSTLAAAHPPSGETQVVVVMKAASCSVCAGQLRQLAAAELGVPLVGITHEPEPMAARVTQVTGVATYSHAAGIRSMGLWLAERGIAQPAVVVYDRCGAEAGRIVGRAPGVDVTAEVRGLVQEAEQVVCAGKPVS